MRNVVGEVGHIFESVTEFTTHYLRLKIIIIIIINLQSHGRKLRQTVSQIRTSNCIIIPLPEIAVRLAAAAASELQRRRGCRRDGSANTNRHRPHQFQKLPPQAINIYIYIYMICVCLCVNLP